MSEKTNGILNKVRPTVLILYSFGMVVVILGFTILDSDHASNIAAALIGGIAACAMTIVRDGD